MNDSVSQEVNLAESPPTRWAISLEWFGHHNRSATLLISEHLCRQCAHELSPEKKDSPPEDMIALIQNCCAKTPEFLNQRLPVLESVFRLFLSNGNQPLELEDVARQLSQWRGGDSYHTSPGALLRLLQNDRFYGLQEIKP